MRTAPPALIPAVHRCRRRSSAKKTVLRMTEPNALPHELNSLVKSQKTRIGCSLALSVLELHVYTAQCLACELVPVHLPRPVPVCVCVSVCVCMCTWVSHVAAARLQARALDATHALHHTRALHASDTSGACSSCSTCIKLCCCALACTQALHARNSSVACSRTRSLHAPMHAGEDPRPTHIHACGLIMCVCVLCVCVYRYMHACIHT
jgi:hypothetical protein